MNLLFITRVVDPNHPIAGFVWEWVREFGEQLSVLSGQLNVITWQEGNAEGLPKNVRVYSVRSEKINRIIGLIRLIGLMVKLVPRSDTVFVHQHPIYAIIVAPFAKFFGKKLYLWYVHKHVDIKLRVAVTLSDGVFTASKESFRLKTTKPVYVVGHGINTELFRPLGVNPPLHPSGGGDFENPLLRGVPEGRGVFRILSVGRISPVKGYEILIEAIQLLTIQPYYNLTVRMVGGTGLRAHQEYAERLKRLVKEKKLEGVVEFVGPKAHREIVEEYQAADLFVNLSDTGSLDKAVLEAMACGVPVVTSNEAFKELLCPIDEQLFSQKNPEAVAHALERIIKMPLEARRQFGGKLRAVVVRDHDLKNLVSRILKVMRVAL